ncbi:metalloregulator ArsR/SmtB family transcription factor [candidate division WOR-3 bacterium]|uniref:Metalloregulator ArsR/SmtB family transcription factor n=1 Tax=candidate division WOR-3 bacterium TaxID=2052148 RepID=A0A9D5QC76_UNCW3|nr:metalloregulator ArsR/SmtB family transcription factor [candidate division WOR-3 bacterium]MBD3363731.1 metalloregulator ArsR/SmtB family transcription factor [candidate division WOR-3 bacterium]
MENVLKLMKALSDETKLRIMFLLLEEELCVCELESVLGMEQSRISHALRVLRESGLISERRQAKWMFYKAADLPLALKAYLTEEAETDPRSKGDRIAASELLSSDKPRSKRCPLRDKD